MSRLGALLILISALLVTSCRSGAGKSESTADSVLLASLTSSGTGNGTAYGGFPGTDARFILNPACLYDKFIPGAAKPPSGTAGCPVEVLPPGSNNQEQAQYYPKHSGYGFDILERVAAIQGPDQALTSVEPVIVLCLWSAAPASTGPARIEVLVRKSRVDGKLKAELSLGNPPDGFYFKFVSPFELSASQQPSSWTFVNQAFSLSIDFSLPSSDGFKSSSHLKTVVDGVPIEQTLDCRTLAGSI